MVGLRTFYMSSLHTYSPMYSNLRGYSLIIGGSLLSLGLISGLLFNIFGSRFRIRFNNWLVNVVSFTGMGLFLNIFVHIESLALFILFYVLSDSFMFFSMSSNVIEAQKMLPGHPAFAASVSMGVAWATGYLLHLGYSSFFGNQVGFVLNSIGIFSLITAGCLLIFSRYFGRAPKES
jgi:FSR family fosmidomycin resistance protein-like MFS transporter